MQPQCRIERRLAAAVRDKLQGPKQPAAADVADVRMRIECRVQASVGTRLRELDSLGSKASDLDIQYQDTVSKLTGLDYAKALSDFTLQQTYLEAAQKSFAKVAGLSLFDIL